MNLGVKDFHPTHIPNNWIIRVDGVVVSMRSGKSTWKKRGDAYGALTHHVRNCKTFQKRLRALMDKYDFQTAWEKADEEYRDWVENHVEFEMLV